MDLLELEFTYTFGGCSRFSKVNGNYLSQSGEIITENVYIIFTDIPHTIRADREKIVNYAEKIIEFAHLALNEETILITVNYMNHIQRVGQPLPA